LDYLLPDGQAGHAALERRHLPAPGQAALSLALQGHRWAFASRALGGAAFEVTLHAEASGEAAAPMQRQRLHVYRQGERTTIFGALGRLDLEEHDPIAHAGDAAGGAGRLTAPMPGKVIALLVKAGETVQAGQPVAVMEAMKMEHTLTAPRSGTVADVLFAVGEQVAEGAELLRLSES
jgi:3-methylcrotonyl-CoA carboxylase alpha subunit